jgi:hypothetical protein
MNPYDPAEDLTRPTVYVNYVEDNPSLINDEFTRVTAAALTDPDPEVHWMQLKALEYEARYLDLRFGGTFDFPLLDNDTGGRRMFEAKVALAEEANRVGYVDLALDISTDANVSRALSDVDTESSSPLIKAAHQRDSERAKNHKVTLARLLGGPCDTTISSWNPLGETVEIPVRSYVGRDSALSEATAIYRRTEESTKKGHLIYIFERTIFT